MNADARSLPQSLQLMQEADWYRDDHHHVGLDFGAQDQVATYDARQGSTDAAAAQLLAEICVGPGMALADIGCGTGVLACQAALLGCRVDAIDISPRMLEATQARAHALGTQVQVRRASFLSFAMPAGSLDVVTSQYALHHLNDFWKLIALQRIHGALKEGGTLFLRDVVFSCDPSDIHQTVDAWLRWMQRERGYSRSENATHVREEHSTFSWVMEGLLERAGFRVRKSKYSRGMYASYLAERIDIPCRQ